MFDGMPPTNRGREAEVLPAEDSRDWFSVLPEVLLCHVLSFLPSEEVVRTSVLARRWRYLWKSVGSVRIGCLDMDEPVPVNELRKFVDYLLLLRGGSPLDTCELRFGDFDGHDAEPRVNLWLRHAVMCKVRVLKLHVHENIFIDPWLTLDDLPLVSQHLTSLQLRGVRCHTSFLNFSSCPALEHLVFESCDLSLATKISSDSLKRLSITDSPSFENFRIGICAPNLVSLYLDNLWNMTPILESMPSLVEAFVALDGDDSCNRLWYAHQDCDCECCDDSDNIGDGGNNSVLLKGLSEAKKLTLISRHDVFIFKRDLRWCPIFNKLRTLLLNDYWCIPDDLHPLACILEHSPNLENLTIQFFSEEPKHKVEMEGSYSSVVRSAAISEHLKIVKIKCEAVDERVIKLLKFLCTLGKKGRGTMPL